MERNEVSENGSYSMKSIEIDGNTIKYQDLGTGQPIVFIHGAFSNANTWRKVIPELSVTYRCIVPDWPFGAHSVPMSETFDFTAHGIAHFIAKFLVKLSLREVIIIANDTGGAYAQVFASKYKEVVSHLVLSNCEGFEIFPPKKFQSLKTMVKVPGYLWLMAKVFRYKSSLKWEMTFGLLSNTLKKEVIHDLYVKEFINSKLIRNDFKKLVMEWDPKYTKEAAVHLSDFSKPVLILWGVDDTKLFPVELGNRLMANFPNATLIEIKKSKTYIQEDNPLDFVHYISLLIK